jgi:Peroxidase, family 2
MNDAWQQTRSSSIPIEPVRNAMSVFRLERVYNGRRSALDAGLPLLLSSPLHFPCHLSRSKPATLSSLLRRQLLRTSTSPFSAPSTQTSSLIRRRMASTSSSSSLSKPAAHAHKGAKCPVTGNHGFCPAQQGDSRSPCPALNTMANHGYMYVPSPSLLS